MGLDLDSTGNCRHNSQQDWTPVATVIDGLGSDKLSSSEIFACQQQGWSYAEWFVKIDMFGFAHVCVEPKACLIIDPDIDLTLIFSSCLILCVSILCFLWHVDVCFHHGHHYQEAHN